jgi:hypothetical protein
LIGTPRPPIVEPSHVARVLRDPAGIDRIAGWRAIASWRPPRTIGMGTGLAVLTCLTAWAVASVSPWMVPVYLALMVLIFITPRNRRQLLRLFQRSAQPVGIDEGSPDRKLSTASVGTVEILYCADQPAHDPAANELTVDPASSAPDPVGSGAVKPWRGRTRARKAGKSAAEAASVLPPVAWIRVGPGKFVRADSATHPIAAVQPVMGSVTEEHGIAPSAFSPTPMIAAVPDDPDDEVPPAPVEPTIAPIPVALPSGKASGGESGCERFRSHDERSRSPARRVSRGFTTALPGANQADRRRTARNGGKSRTAVWSSTGFNRPPQQSARRALGRVVQRRRALRPRSPPRSVVRLSSKDQHGVAVAEKSITATDGLSIGGLNQIKPGECADQNEQAAAG